MVNVAHLSLRRQALFGIMVNVAPFPGPVPPPRHPMPTSHVDRTAVRYCVYLRTPRSDIIQASSGRSSRYGSRGIQKYVRAAKQELQHVFLFALRVRTIFAKALRSWRRVSFTKAHQHTTSVLALIAVLTPLVLEAMRAAAAQASVWSCALGRARRVQ